MTPVPRRIDPDWLVDRYLDRRQPVEQIAADAGVHPVTVYQAIRAYDIPHRGPVGRESWGDVLTLDYLTAARNEGMSISAIAREVGCHSRTVEEHLAAHGLRNTLSRHEARQLRRLYEREELSIPQIAGILDVGKRTARIRLLEAGVTLRRPGRPPV